jgi:hypothetical protein
MTWGAADSVVYMIFLLRTHEMIDLPRLFWFSCDWASGAFARLAVPIQKQFSWWLVGPVTWANAYWGSRCGGCRAVRGGFSLAATSSKMEALDMMAEVERVLTMLNISYTKV